MSNVSKWIPLWITLTIFLIIKRLFSKPFISIVLVVSDRHIRSVNGCETKTGRKFPEEWREIPE